MPIYLPPGPPGALDLIRNSVPLFLSSAPENTRMRTASVGLANLSVSAPHRVFLASLEDIASGNLLSNAREMSWRYFLVRSNDEPIAAAEIAGDEVTHVNEGPFVQGSANAMVAAEEAVANSERTYELRLLSIPAVHTIAVWLAAPDHDILIPSEPAPAALAANEPYDETSFTQALRPLALLRQDISPGMA